jgi:small-conductance mechanosensitive channel
MSCSNRYGEAISSKAPRSKSAPVRGWPLRLLALSGVLSVGVVVADNIPGLRPADVIQFLRNTGDWYRQVQLDQQIADEPVDLTFLPDQQRLADEIVRWAFEFARQTAPLVENVSPSNQSENPAILFDSHALAEAAAKLDQQASQTQAQLEGLERERQTAPRARQAEIGSQIKLLQRQLALQRARQGAVNSLISFLASTTMSGLGTTDLHSEIEDVARTLPPFLSQPPKEDRGESGTETLASKAALAARPAPAGLLGLAGEWWRLSHKAGRITEEILMTETLAQSTKQLTMPLANRLKQMMQSGQQPVTQEIQGDPAALAARTQELDALVLQFKHTSAALLPIRKQGVLLDLYQRSLNNWRSTVIREDRDVIESLLVRVAILAITLGVVFGIGEVVRRTILRYVTDVRRRYQFLLLRKIGLWVGIGAVLVFALSTELRSVVTFAGLITAGVAVALQNVILAIVGYFFLIGKYGIRIGDRVNVGGVSGEVVEIGLVRFYLMELEIRGSEALPTGRITAFSNSIVFQAGAGLFKRIPGTNFMWHEITLTFAPESDYQEIGKRLHEAVEAVFRDYQDTLERQQQQMQQSLNPMTPIELRPTVRLRFTAAGTEAVIEYPVVLRQATDIDEKLMRELLAAVDHEPRLKLIGTEAATVKLVA